MFAAALAALCLGACQEPGEVYDQPELKLLTSLPLVFSNQFSLQGGSPTLDALERRFDVVAIGTTSREELADADLLFMAHALPQTAENLVSLDEWVRGGGRVLLLADPQLDWDTGLPLGHPQAPPYFFGDTGLIGHWGLTLEGPRDATEIEGVPVSSAGRLTATNDACAVTHDGLLAECSIGEGRAIVIADADLLNEDTREGIVFVMTALDSLAR